VNLDVTELLTALGGGAPAVMVVGMGGAVLLLWRRYVATQDARIEDQKEHTAQIIEAIRSMQKAIDYVERRRD